MIKAVFYITNDCFEGFVVSGHDDSGKSGQNIVCAAVSSAVMLTVNTITDYLKTDAVPRTGVNKAGVKVLIPSKASDAVIRSLEAHLRLIGKSGGKIRVIRKTILKEGF